MTSPFAGHFAPVPGYLDAATLGLPPRRTVAALQAAVQEWAAGRASAAAYDEAVARSRAAYAGLVGVPVADVAVGPQVSVLVGTVAASLPDGAEVLVAAGDFTSVTFPFEVQADRGVRVRHVPLDVLADEVRPSTTCVAVSLVQSATGQVLDAPAVLEAARRVGALTVLDTTQAAGWLPVDAGAWDVTVCGAYKWLCAPRGTAFLTAGAAARQRLRPVNAGWYAGDAVWESVYGPAMRLASSARRFDVSPAWLPWVGTAESLDVVTGWAPAAVLAHGSGLADRLRTGLGLEPAGRPVVALPDADGGLRARLEAAGCRVAGRGGRVRVAFHLWNDDDDVDRALRALRG